MVGNIQQMSIDDKVAQFNQIGENHLKDNLSQRTTNWLERTFSHFFSNDSNNRAVSNLIKDIRENPGFGDWHAAIAQKMLTDLVGKGKPLTGRVAAQVLSEIKIGKELMTSKDMTSIQEEVALGLKHKGGVPSNADILKAMSPIAMEHYRVKVLNHNSVKIEEAVEDLKGLKDDIKARFEERGEDGIELSDALVKAMQRKIVDQLNITSSETNKFYADNKDPAIEEVKAKIIDTLVEAFTCITGEDEDVVPYNVKSILKETLASNQIIPTKDISLYALQGFKDDICKDIYRNVVGLGERNPAKFTHKFLASLDETYKRCIKADKDINIDDKALDAVKACLFKVGMIDYPNCPEIPKQKAWNFCLAGIKNAGLKENEEIKDSIEDVVFHTALAKNLVHRVKADSFMKENHKIHETSREMVEDVFAHIPLSPTDTLQMDALNLIKEHYDSDLGPIPQKARVEIDKTDPQHPKPVVVRSWG